MGLPLASLIVGLCLASDVWAQQPASKDVAKDNQSQASDTIEDRVIGSALHRSSVAHDVPIRVQNVRIEPAPRMEGMPSANVKFDIVNEGSNSFTDVVVEISVVKKATLTIGGDTTPVVLAGPFKIRGDVALEPGFSISYEIRLRNLSTECGCVPNVKLVSVHALSSR